MENAVIYVAGDPEAYPIEYYDEQTGAYQGLIPALLERFGREQGYDVRYYEPDKGDQRQTLAEDRQVDIVSDGGGGADFRRGGFSEEEFEEETPLETSPYPLQLTEYYDYTNEYLTAPRLGVELGARRNIRRFYLDLSARYEHGFNLEFVPRAHRVTVLLSVGYDF